MWSASESLHLYLYNRSFFLSFGSEVFRCVSLIRLESRKLFWIRVFFNIWSDQIIFNTSLSLYQINVRKSFCYSATDYSRYVFVYFSNFKFQNGSLNLWYIKWVANFVLKKKKMNWINWLKIKCLNEYKIELIFRETHLFQFILDLCKINYSYSVLHKKLDCSIFQIKLCDMTYQNYYNEQHSGRESAVYTKAFRICHKCFGENSERTEDVFYWGCAGIISLFFRSTKRIITSCVPTLIINVIIIVCI